MFEKDFYYEVEKPEALKHILYGDSVSKDTTTIVQWKNENAREVISFEELWNRLEFNFKLPIVKQQYQEDKEYIFLNDEFKTLSYNSSRDKLILTTPEYIVRHTTNENLTRLKINGNNYLDVTNQHSLLEYDHVEKKLKEIMPDECRYLPIIDNQVKFNYSIDIDYFLLGLFYGDGNFSGKNEYYPRFTSSKRDSLIKFIKSYLPETTIYYKHSSLYDFHVNRNKLDLLLEESNLKQTKSPDREITDNLFGLLNEDYNKLLNFISGYYLADGSLSSGVITLISSSYNLLKRLSLLINNLGIFSCVEIDKNNRKYNDEVKGDIYKLKILTTNSKLIEILNETIQFKNSNKIEKKGTFYGIGTSRQNRNITRKLQNAEIRNIRPLKVKGKEQINYNDYVYDLGIPKTQNFFANGFLVHNTDSIFISVPVEDVPNLSAEKRWELAENTASEINDLIINYTRDTLLPRCNINPEQNRTNFDTELVMESIMFLDVKKNYAYKLLVKEGKILEVPKVDYKGIQVIKSDAAKMTQNLLREMIENVILNQEIPNKDKSTEIFKIIENYYNQFQNDIKNLDITDIGVPVKWSKDNQAINGMIAYNHIMDEEIFTFGSAGKFVYANFQNQSYFKNTDIDLNNLRGITVPYNYNIEILKEKMNNFKVSFDQKGQWNDKIFTTTCQRIVNLAKKVSKENQ